MKQNTVIIIILSFISVLLIIPGLFDLFLTPDINVAFRNIKTNEKNMMYVCDIPITSQAYRAGLEIGDTVVSVNSNYYKNSYDLKKRLFYQKNINDTLIFTIVNNNIVKNIPLVLLRRNPLKRTLFMILTIFSTFIILLFFFYTFPGDKQFALIIFIFYLFVLILYTYTYVSFEKPFLYLILLFSASFSPCFPILVFFNLKRKNKLSAKYFIVPLSFSFAIFTLWSIFYVKWVVNFDTNNLDQFFEINQIVQGLIVVMTLIGISGITLTIISKSKKTYEKYIQIALLFIFSGFVPYITLYAFPAAFGLHEIASIDVVLSFIFLPLLGLVIYNKFIYAR